MIFHKLLMKLVLALTPAIGVRLSLNLLQVLGVTVTMDAV
jgi:hypothetical protein